MSHKRPKGIIILSLVLLLFSLSLIPSLFRATPDSVVFNFIIQEPFEQLYLTFFIGLGIAVSIGLFFLKRWSYIVFLVTRALEILLGILNILLTKRNTLLQAGWDNSDLLLPIFKSGIFIAILMEVALIIWIVCYRRYFTEAENEAGGRINHP